MLSPFEKQQLFQIASFNAKQMYTLTYHTYTIKKAAALVCTAALLL